jgi:hypothetical protein
MAWNHISAPGDGREPARPSPVAEAYERSGHFNRGGAHSVSAASGAAIPNQEWICHDQARFSTIHWGLGGALTRIGTNLPERLDLSPSIARPSVARLVTGFNMIRGV